MRDFLTSAPLGIGALIKSSYEFQMKYAAWSYDLTYRLWYTLPALCPPIGWTMARITGRRLLRWADDYHADVVVSTYPLTSVVLGQLRRAGRLNIPAINFITDFGIHPLWTHRGIDLNLAVHPRPAGLARAKSGRPTIATGPLVSPRFAEYHDRDAIRADLGLAPADRAVLIVSGSWGVGDVAQTFRAIAASDQFVPIVVCGRDERLRARLSQIPGGRAIGWTDDMPGLMAAVDALVENAGGLTAMEALSIGLPIIAFRPIAGHGKENTAEMQAAGVSRLAKNRGQLVELLEQVTVAGPLRQSLVAAGQAMFVADPTRFVEHASTAGVAGVADLGLLAAVAGPAALGGRAEAPVVVAGPAAVAGGADTAPEELADIVAIGSRRPRRPSVAVARIAAVIAAVPLLWAALTTGVGVATAYGAGVAHPRSNVGNVAYIGVRLSEEQLDDALIGQQLAALHATAVVDQQTAALDPADVQRLVSLGVDIENGGAGQQVNRQGRVVSKAPWQRANGDIQASRTIERIAGQPVKMFVPGRRLNAFDLVASYGAHRRTVVPNAIFDPDDTDGPIHITARHTYLVNGVNATTRQVRDMLMQLADQLAVANLSGAPLADLK